MFRHATAAKIQANAPRTSKFNTVNHLANYRLIPWPLLVVVLIGPPAVAQDADSATSTGDTFAGENAWQANEGLAEKWQESTGRFIFHRTCLPCHRQGLATFTDFPDQRHTALLPEEFGDLTAMFPYGRMVADDGARFQSLETFLFKQAPERKVPAPDADSQAAVDLLHAVGESAPDFSIVDIEGQERSLIRYIRDGKRLILEF